MTSDIDGGKKGVKGGASSGMRAEGGRRRGDADPACASVGRSSRRSRHLGMVGSVLTELPARATVLHSTALVVTVEALPRPRRAGHAAPFTSASGSCCLCCMFCASREFLMRACGTSVPSAIPRDKQADPRMGPSPPARDLTCCARPVPPGKRETGSRVVWCFRPAIDPTCHLGLACS
jgi:hypothetical protein